MSDFGRDAMEKENRFGPQGIWKVDEIVRKTARMKNQNDDDDEEEDEVEEDVYDKVEVSQDFGEEDSDVDLDELSEDAISVHRAAGSSKEEFKRPSDAQGVVLHSELKRRKGKDKSDIDDLALRMYEKRRLKYYFAVAEFDNVQTAVTIYEQLDGYHSFHFE